MEFEGVANIYLSISLRDLKVNLWDYLGNVVITPKG